MRCLWLALPTQMWWRKDLPTECTISTPSAVAGPSHQSDSVPIVAVDNVSVGPAFSTNEIIKGASSDPTVFAGWQEGEEQGGGLRAGDHRRPPASHPGDLGRRRRAPARPQRGEEQEHEGRPGRRHPAHLHPGMINRVLISNNSNPDDATCP